MFQFEQNTKQKRNDNSRRQVVLTGQGDWAAITQQFMLKTEQHPIDEGIPPAPLPPNISHLCYFHGIQLHVLKTFSVI